MTTLTRTCRRVPATGTVRWLCDSPRDLLLAGLSAPLSITVDLTAGPKTDFYWCCIDTHGGWLLSKEAADGQSAAHYHLDPECHSCSCPDIRSGAGTCKHSRGLKAALRKVGIVQL